MARVTVFLVTDGKQDPTEVVVFACECFENDF